MSTGRAFRIPNAHKDRVQPRQLAAIAATCLSIGVALSGVLPASPKERARGHEEHWQSASTGPTQLVIDAANALQTSAQNALQARDEARTETSIHAAMVAPAADSATTAPNAATDKPHKPARAKLLRGAVSYRCDASKQGTCPRDRALEARIWRVLSRLASCSDTARASGRADLRLWVEPGTATRVVFAAPTISPSLNLRAVSQCVARDLSKLRATRKADRFELSLGFGLAGSNAASGSKLLED
jgi:hypothetical protein